MVEGTPNTPKQELESITKKTDGQVVPGTPATSRRRAGLLVTERGNLYEVTVSNCPSCGFPLASDSSEVSCPMCSASLSLSSISVDTLSPDQLTERSTEDIHINSMRAEKILNERGLSLSDNLPVETELYLQSMLSSIFEPMTKRPNKLDAQTARDFLQEWLGEDFQETEASDRGLFQFLRYDYPPSLFSAEVLRNINDKAGAKAKIKLIHMAVRHTQAFFGEKAVQSELLSQIADLVDNPEAAKGLEIDEDSQDFKKWINTVRKKTRAHLLKTPDLPDVIITEQQPLELSCSSCGAPIVSGQSACLKCGAQVQAETATYQPGKYLDAPVQAITFDEIDHAPLDIKIEMQDRDFQRLAVLLTQAFDTLEPHEVNQAIHSWHLPNNFAYQVRYDSSNGQESIDSLISAMRRYLTDSKAAFFLTQTALMYYGVPLQDKRLMKLYETVSQGILDEDKTINVELPEFEDAHLATVNEVRVDDEHFADDWRIFLDQQEQPLVPDYTRERLGNLEDFLGTMGESTKLTLKREEFIFLMHTIVPVLNRQVSDSTEAKAVWLANRIGVDQTSASQFNLHYGLVIPELMDFSDWDPRILGLLVAAVDEDRLQNHSKNNSDWRDEAPATWALRQISLGRATDQDRDRVQESLSPYQMCEQVFISDNYVREVPPEIREASSRQTEAVTDSSGEHETGRFLGTVFNRFARRRDETNISPEDQKNIELPFSEEEKVEILKKIGELKTRTEALIELEGLLQTDELIDYIRTTALYSGKGDKSPRAFLESLDEVVQTNPEVFKAIVVNMWNRGFKQPFTGIMAKNPDYFFEQEQSQATFGEFTPEFALEISNLTTPYFSRVKNPDHIKQLLDEIAKDSNNKVADDPLEGSPRAQADDLLFRRIQQTQKPKQHIRRLLMLMWERSDYQRRAKIERYLEILS